MPQEETIPKFYISTSKVPIRIYRYKIVESVLDTPDMEHWVRIEFTPWAELMPSTPEDLDKKEVEETKEYLDPNKSNQERIELVVKELTEYNNKQLHMACRLKPPGDHIITLKFLRV